jgi:phospholipase/carboxylesterase
VLIGIGTNLSELETPGWLASDDLGAIGATNGQLFSHAIAFSPGFWAPGDTRGAPSFFVTHGTADQVLAIDATSRRGVPRLERAGYDVRYREFPGGHTVPGDLAAAAVMWFLGDGA